jgi:biotin carboxylase
MTDGPSRTLLCLASYEKGADFLRECKRRGWTVLLLTLPALREAAWPRESIDDLYVMPDLADTAALINGVSYLARSRAIERIVPLDDYDVEMAAALREHLRLPGMGASAARYVRDKVAMRLRAHAAGLPVPDFTPVFNDAAVAAFMERVPPPWLLKPRSEVSTIGITRVDDAQECWARLESLGDRRSFHLLERFVPGSVYHVDSLVYRGEVLFAEAHAYGRPPLEVFHHGGLAITRTVARGSADEEALLDLNRRVVAALGLTDGAGHVEFIRGEADGRLYFLEIGARVGGANIADVVEAATGINLWAEWAGIETAGAGGYVVPPRRHDYAGAIISLARQEHPDTTDYADAEIVRRIEKPHHVGFVLASPDRERVAALLEEYSRRIAVDFAATLPPWMERPPAPPAASTPPA